MLYKCAIFDLWNTLVYIPEKFNPVSRIQSVLSSEGAAEFFSYMDAYWKKGQMVTIRDILDLYAEKKGVKISSSRRKKCHVIWKEYIENAILLPEAINVLDKLRCKSIKLGIVANMVSPSLPVFDILELHKFVDVITTSCETGFLKPDPRIFAITFDALGCIPSRSVVIGDKFRTDLLGGMILGASTILLDSRFPTLQLSDDMPVTAIAPSIRDIIQICGCLP